MLLGNELAIRRCKQFGKTIVINEYACYYSFLEVTRGEGPCHEEENCCIFENALATLGDHLSSRGEHPKDVDG